MTHVPVIYEKLCLSADEKRECLYVLESHACTLGYCEEGILGYVELDSDLVGEAFVKSSEHRATAGKEYTVGHDVRVEFGRSLVESLEHGSLNARDGFLDTV